MQIYICIIQKCDYNMTVDTMEKTSRQKIFELIQKHQLVTVSELNLYLDMTPANIRHHLAVLQMEGLVEKIDKRERNSKGRPEAVYSVSNIFIEDGLESLSNGILKIWLASEPLDHVDIKMKAIARLLAEDGLGQINYPIAKKLTEAMNYLNSLHYQAHWEASLSGPRIIFGHCPYQKIISRNPEICMMDKYLLEELVGYEFLQVSKLERDEKGKFHCRFIRSYG
jgi:predicted ArsR family transcriptional regulator